MLTNFQNIICLHSHKNTILESQQSSCLWRSSKSITARTEKPYPSLLPKQDRGDIGKCMMLRCCWSATTTILHYRRCQLGLVRICSLTSVEPHHLYPWNKMTGWRMGSCTPASPQCPCISPNSSSLDLSVLEGEESAAGYQSGLHKWRHLHLICLVRTPNPIKVPSNVQANSTCSGQGLRGMVLEQTFPSHPLDSGLPIIIHI